MPYLQFLNGSRDQDFEQLNENASLVVGSAGDAHVRNGDDGIAPKHATVYPAQGAFWLQDMGAGTTIFKMQRLASTTQGLQPGDVFIIGSTYVKFWQDKPAGGGGGGGGGADPAALEQAQKDLAAAKAELEQVRSAGAGHEDQVKGLEGSLAEVQGKLDAAEKELETTRQSLTEATERATQLEGDVATAKADAEAEIAKAKEEADRERADGEAALEASRTALEAMQAEQKTAGIDPMDAMLAPSDLSQALEALALPDPIRARVEQAVAAEIDREVLRRSAGPVVPLRGFRIPGSNRDVESEIRSIRRRGEQVDAARKHGLGKLDAEELERLLEMARN